MSDHRHEYYELKETLERELAEVKGELEASQRKAARLRTELVGRTETASMLQMMLLLPLLLQLVLPLLYLSLVQILLCLPS